MPTSAVGSGPPTLDEIRIAMEFIASQPRGESGSGVVTEGFGAPSLSLPSPRGVQTPDAGALASSRAGRSSSSISLSGGGGGGPELELTLRDLLLFLQKKRTVAAEYSVGLVNRMFSEATEKAALTAVDLLNATKMGTFCADWAAVVRLALGSKLQHDLSAASRAASLGKPLPSPPSSRGGQHGTRGGTAPSPRGTFVRRSQPFHIPPSPRRRPQQHTAGGSFTSTSPRSPRRAQQPQAATGAAAATATASRAALGAGTGSGAINNAKTSGRFLPLIRHPPWSVHADGIESPPDGFDRELVDDLGRTLHDVNALKAEIRRIEIEKARPNDQGIIFCGSSTSAISAVVVDVGHNSTPKFLRSCHVPKGPSNLTIEEVVSGRNSPDHHGGSSPSLSPHKAGRPLTQRQKDALRRQQVAAEEEMYQNVLSKIVNYLS